jgi:hypothetical protein
MQVFGDGVDRSFANLAAVQVHARHARLRGEGDEHRFVRGQFTAAQAVPRFRQHNDGTAFGRFVGERRKLSGIRSAAISLSSRSDVYRSGPTIDGLESRDLQLIGLRGEPRFDAVHQLAFMPLRMGMRDGCHRHRARGRRRKTQPR